MTGERLCSVCGMIMTGEHRRTLIRSQTWPSATGCLVICSIVLSRLLIEIQLSQLFLILCCLVYLLVACSQLESFMIANRMVDLIFVTC
jgi:hypothetical protein